MARGVRGMMNIKVYVKGGGLCYATRRTTDSDWKIVSVGGVASASNCHRTPERILAMLLAMANEAGGAIDFEAFVETAYDCQPVRGMGAEWARLRRAA